MTNIDDIADETFTSSLCTMMLPVYSSYTFHSQDLICNSPYFYHPIHMMLIGRIRY